MRFPLAIPHRGRLQILHALALITLGGFPFVAGASDVDQQVLALINTARAQAGCPALTPNAALTRAAQTQSTGMAAQNYFSHRDKDGHSYTHRAKAQGYVYHWIGENIAAGQTSAAAVVQSWLNSPPHRRNILNCRFTETGVSMTYQADDQPLRGINQPLNYYWVQVFGTPW